MKIKVSNTMVNYINSLADKNILHIDYAEIVEYSATEYDCFVGSSWIAFDYGDYNSRTGKFKAIMIVYPIEYYSNNRYISTEYLNRQSIKTEEDLKQILVDMINI